MAERKFNAELVKSRISLKALFERDGHVLKRSGNSYVCNSPFNKEKTASCHVHEDQGYFKCFSSGVGGDCFNYWMATHNATFLEALEALAVMAGMAAGSVRTLPPPVKRYERADGEELAPRLDEKALQRWLEAAAALARNEAECERIAKWRGIQPLTVKWAAERGLMAMMPYYGIAREAFLVERPEVTVSGETPNSKIQAPNKIENSNSKKQNPAADGGLMIPIGWHVRLGPFTAGNEHAKASWRFAPKGIGSFPFVAGDVATARGLIVLEGQWDALAFIDLLGWHEQWQPHTAVIGMRGATSWKKFLAHFPLAKEAVLVTISDRDAAGEGWNKKGGFYEQAERRCRRVIAYRPTADSGGKDFNDLTKAGVIRREALVYALQNKLAKTRQRQRMSFLKFCKAMVHRDDTVGAAARTVLVDKGRPRRSRRLRDWQRHWDSLHLDAGERAGLEAIWHEWILS
jgi:hypothetical protein